MQLVEQVAFIILMQQVLLHYDLDHDSSLTTTVMMSHKTFFNKSNQVADKLFFNAQRNPRTCTQTIFVCDFHSPFSDPQEIKNVKNYCNNTTR